MNVSENHEVDFNRYNSIYIIIFKLQIWLSLERNKKILIFKMNIWFIDRKMNIL